MVFGLWFGCGVVWCGGLFLVGCVVVVVLGEVVVFYWVVVEG